MRYTFTCPNKKCRWRLSTPVPKGRKTVMCCFCRQEFRVKELKLQEESDAGTAVVNTR